jgi:hypothetical protein
MLKRIQFDYLRKLIIFLERMSDINKEFNLENLDTEEGPPEFVLKKAQSMNPGAALTNRVRQQINCQCGG